MKKLMVFLGLTNLCLGVGASEKIAVGKLEKDYQIKNYGSRDTVFYNAQASPLSLEGLPWLKENQGKYCRLPLRLSDSEISRTLRSHSWHTSGVALRFRTDSEFVVLRAKLPRFHDMNHMSRLGSAGFDVYRRDPGCSEMVFVHSLPRGSKQYEINALAGVQRGSGVCDWQINFPLYAGVDSVEIGIAAGSKIEKPTPHKIQKPILFYGPSTTQGACASRPGNMYPTMLCRALDAEQINLGFSGNAKGEEAVAREIAKLDLAAFVYDYDANSPTTEHLAATHEKFFRIVRERNPDLPVIIISRTSIRGATPVVRERRDVIRKTCDNAISRGDKNVYFIDGCTLFGDEMSSDCTVDYAHPNDLGFYRMYRGILPVLKKALKIN